MNTKLISEKALAVIDQYKNFRIENAICSIPYFNNRKTGLRGALRAEVGKGSPSDIFEEIQNIALKTKFDTKNFSSESLKKFLVDQNIGIDCSGFAYYVLNAESKEKDKGTLDKHLTFRDQRGIIGRFRAKMKPVENTGVTTLASDKNSKVISLEKTEPGDMIIMLGGPEDGERNHILIVNQVEYQNFKPVTIHYTHSIAWPSDGEYGHGISTGIIEIIKPGGSLTEQRWIEKEKTGEENYTYSRAVKSKTELRRLSFYASL